MRDHGGDASTGDDDLVIGRSCSQEVAMDRRRKAQRSTLGKRCSVSLLVAFLIAIATFGTQTISVAASEIRTGDDPNVPVGETVNDDLYIFGGDVDIAGTVNGDAVVTAGNLDVPGRVDGSLAIIAGQVEISGTVERAVRVAAGDVTISGDLGGDLLVTGGRVTIESTGAIGGDLVVASGDVTILGPVDGDVRGNIGNLTINEEIGGDVRVTADDIELQSDAQIAGDLDYTSPSEADLDDGAAVTGVRSHNETSRFTPGDNWVNWVLSPLFRLLVALFTGLVLILLLPRATAIVADGIRRSPAGSFVLGLILLVFVPIVSLILFVTLVGIPIAIILWLSYLAVLYLSQIFLGIALGRTILPKSWDTTGRGYNLLAMTLGVVFLAALRIIPLPFLDSVIAAITAIFGLGAIILGPRHWRTQSPATPAY
jgi:cytoskeletal protein CcmA (bactofilin family)